MKVVFLCGGVGRRMFPLKEGKFLYKFLGRTLLEHQIELARGAGLDRFLIITGPASLAAIQGLASQFPESSFETVVQEAPQGMGHALERAAPLLGDEFLVVNPNDVFDASAYHLLLDAAREGTAACYLLGRRVGEPFPGGYLVVDSKGRLKEIVEKPRPGEEPSDLVNIVVHLHRRGRRFLEAVSRSSAPADSAYEEALNSLVGAEDKVQVVPYEGFWAAIKYPWHLFPVMEHFLARMEPRIAPSAHVSARAVIEGPVVLEEGVRVLENAVLRGPCYVGKDTVIGNNVLIRGGCHIGEGCVVGFSTEVKRSYIGDGCQFHMNYVGDSLLGDGCSLGAGTMTANWRLDRGTIKVAVGGQVIDTGLDKLGVIMGDFSRTGVNVSLMPGVKVGPRAWVGPQVCLGRDLGPGQVVLAEPGHPTWDKGRAAPCAE